MVLGLGEAFKFPEQEQRRQLPGSRQKVGSTYIQGNDEGQPAGRATKAGQPLCITAPVSCTFSCCCNGQHLKLAIACRVLEKKVSLFGRGCAWASPAQRTCTPPPSSTAQSASPFLTHQDHLPAATGPARDERCFGVNPGARESKWVLATSLSVPFPRSHPTALPSRASSWPGWVDAGGVSHQMRLDISLVFSLRKKERSLQILHFFFLFLLFRGSPPPSHSSASSSLAQGPQAPPLKSG